MGCGINTFGGAVFARAALAWLVVWGLRVRKAPSRERERAEIYKLVLAGVRGIGTARACGALEKQVFCVLSYV